ncbi:MAG: hypothetical protein ACREX9_05965 [Gammaproteobacteria bacterium]
MGGFFTDAAFGGAYAVAAYLYQGRVERYGWLTGSQMIDGLAPPHPARLSSWWPRGLHRRQNLGSLRPRRPAALGYRGAGVATLLAFLPSARRHPTPRPSCRSTSLDRHGGLASGHPLLPARHAEAPITTQSSAGSGPNGSLVLTLTSRLGEDTIPADGL